jgi:hypothetical protein
MYRVHFSSHRSVKMYSVKDVTATGRKKGFSTGSIGAFVPENKPVQKIRDKRPPLFGTGSLQTGIKGASTLAPGECRR